MITIAVTKAYAIVTSRELLTSGMSNVAQVAFTFSSDWDGLNKTSVWTDGTVTVDVSDASWSNNICNIPHEVLTTSGRIVRVGIYGTDGSTTVLPTIWAEIGRVRGGADPSGDPSVTPTPTVQAQLLAAASAAGQAKLDAEASRDAAENSASEIKNLTVSAETVEPGVPASVEKTTVAGIYNLGFRLPRGHDGLGVPTGGTAGQILVKSGADNYAAEWRTPAARAEADNTLPISSAAVYTELGNVEILLAAL